ncbi:MAG TPA: triose-phosphate isomerase [Candidatus Omnitrophica bacterium]|nr:triose-phosphate isomerase [Candidatus Omnitrophota bacterium]
MRRTVIAGNWKMHKTIQEATELVEKLKQNLIDVTGKEVVLCPPFTALSSVHEIIKDTHIKLGAQNIFWEAEGAFTGEISSTMIKEAGCEFVIIGHSERRKYFGENGAVVNKKIKLAFSSELSPIFCVGETLKERENGLAEETVIKQVNDGLVGIVEESLERLIIAYEPVWAIGTGKTATPEVAESMHRLIRSHLSQIYSSNLSDMVPILYGGSVKPENIDSLMHQEDIDGVLVGGASLESESFTRIVKFMV